MLRSATSGRNFDGGERTAQIHGEGNRARAQRYEVRARLPQVYVLGYAHTSACTELNTQLNNRKPD